MIQAILARALQENHLVLIEQAKQQLVQYLELMQTWNRVFNLTSITTPHDMVYLHLIDSLIVQPYLKGERMLDIGTGAGLPGIPLAIANPERSWVLLDKNSKKTRFLTQVVSELGLGNVTIVHSRVESYRPAQSFDSILSRAFGTIALFIETAAPLLHKQGRLIALKGKYPAAELAEITKPWQATDVVRLAITGKEMERHIVCLSTP